MNWTKDTGWYYDTLHNRAAAWTSVHYFYQFAVNNQETGFFGREVPVQEVRAGDVIQLGTGYFHHSLFVIAVIRKMPYLAAHTADVYHVPLSAYRYDRIRCLHIIGARKQI